MNNSLPVYYSFFTGILQGGVSGRISDPCRIGTSVNIQVGTSRHPVKERVPRLHVRAACSPDIMSHSIEHSTLSEVILLNIHELSVTFSFHDITPIVSFPLS